MIFARDFHLSNFTSKLSILSNYIEHSKKISAILCITPFYNSKIFTSNNLTRLFKEDDFGLR